VGKRITKEEISVLAAEEFPGCIYVADKPDAVNKSVDYLSQFKMLGFDTETRPTFKKGKMRKISLIQLSTKDSCFLFRLSENSFYPSLIALLSNPEIIKVGLSLKDDFSSIRRVINFEPQGFVDIQDMVSDYGIDDISLQKVYAILFGKKISKSQRLTNWEADQLSEAQKKYAALDAWACLKIYEKLCHI
jgi:ribonuclease D